MTPYSTPIEIEVNDTDGNKLLDSIFDYSNSKSLISQVDEQFKSQESHIPFFYYS